MGYIVKDFEMEEANSGDFTFEDETDATTYSKEYDAGSGVELKIFVKITKTNESGGTAVATLQMYNNALDNWEDHGTAFSAISVAATEFKDFTSFGSKIRIELNPGGTFAATETMTVTFGAILKGLSN